ncbi:CBS domain-containing protein [Sorangium sp. So ce136]|uniref:CBS domain-containing protein n=1 Tax=Sorangium sp. So ce136 TaxID=3133284 RepID=UPI003F02A372
MMRFATPVSRYMTCEVITAPDTTPLPEVHRSLGEHAISCVPVVDAASRAIGVLSRTDLLRLGRFDTKTNSRGMLLTLPDVPARDVLRPGIITVGRTTLVVQAASVLLKHRIHRVFVREGDSLTGVFSTKDLLLALVEARDATPIAELMSAPAYTIPLDAPLALAADRLTTAQVSGLVVVDPDGWPVGMFTQTEALLAHGVLSDSPVEDVMSPAMVCLDVRTPLHRAAAAAHAAQARRVLVVQGRRLRGVLTGLDFARAVAGTGVIPVAARSKAG